MASFSNEEVYLISKGLYWIVSDIVGSEPIVKLRRTQWTNYDVLNNCNTSPSAILITSGSKGEGFLFQSSDFDFMDVSSEAIVIDKNTLSSFYSANFRTLFLMETECMPPGFALIKCLKCSQNNDLIFSSLEIRGKNVYVSSKSIREKYLSGKNRTVHGPCMSGTLEGKEFDFAFTLKCPNWPEQALSFVSRSLHNGWPSIDVLKDVCKEGCLLVPTNSKQHTCSDMTDLEWRISFSLAEKKLVHSMNHCQFLCYGLMKIFLNEILKPIPETGELLCSYFMKTAVFWEISENINDWSPHFFIYSFWNVFRRIIKWVSVGYCPNFFIPENNMFYGKIQGSQQRDLMTRLLALYREGFPCLLWCSSLNEKLCRIINQPLLSIFMSPNEEDNVPVIEIEKEILQMIHYATSLPYPLDHGSSVMATLYNTTVLIPSSHEMESMIKLRINNILQGVASMLCFVPSQIKIFYTWNKYRYRYINIADYLLKTVKTSFCMNRVRHALCMYNVGNYRKTIAIIMLIKHKFQNERFMYAWTPNDDIITRSRQYGMSYEAIVKKFVNKSVIMDPPLTISELHLEHIGVAQTGISIGVLVPPLVLLNFLLVLSYTRLNELQCRNDALSELQTLLMLDDGYHIPVKEKAISWEILGICQQHCGDYHSAYLSYNKALNDKYNNVQPATIIRINGLYR